MAEQTFESAPSSVAAARHAAVDTLHKWGVPEGDPLIGTIELVTSELVTNAVRASSAGVQVRLSSQRDELVVAVRDGNPVPPVLGRLDTADQSGRGLAIVAAVASDWGWDVIDDHAKTVWCRLRVPTGSALNRRCTA